MRTPNLVSTIVLNWNNKETVFACLDSLLSQSYAHQEIILVDNASQDGSPIIIRERYGSKIKFIQNSKNLGFSGGVNTGLKVARGEFVALLNSDAYADSDWLQALVDGIRIEDSVGMCASKIYLANQPHVLDNTGEIICRDGLGIARGRLEEDHGQFDESDDVLCPSGCAALYRRKMLDEVGGFDSRFFVYAEDVEIGIKGRLLGYRCRYIPEAVVHHHLSRSSGVISTMKAYFVERNRLWIVIKCFPWLDVVKSFWHTFFRYFFHSYGVLKKKGPAAVYTKKFTFFALVWIVIRAHVSTLWNLPHLLRERRYIQSRKQLTKAGFKRLLDVYTVSEQQAAWRELL